VAQEARHREAPAEPPVHSAPSPAAASATEARERFARALYAVLQERGGRQDLTQNRVELIAQYERLVREHKDLRLDDADADGQVAVGAVSVLAQRSGDRVEELVRKALTGKGFDAHLVKVACELVHDQLTSDLKEGH
jgi:hypothetical protein